MNTNDTTQTKRWLKQLARRGGQWQKLAKLAAVVQALMIVLQAWLLAQLLHLVIIEGQSADELLSLFALAAMAVVLRYTAAWCREASAVKASQSVQQSLRQELIDRLYQLGPSWRSKQRGGQLVSQLQEQVAGIDGYLSKYVPQMGLIMTVPILVLLATVPLSWVATLIFLSTLPLIPVFMILVGWKARDKQIEQQQQLARMSGHFLDQLRGLTTLQLFNRQHQQAAVIADVSEQFRLRTMSVLRLAFLSSTVLEFFASISIALIAVYLGFSFLGYFNFGLYGQPLTLSTAFFILLLAPEFYLPLRELGSHYHAKAEAEAAAEQLLPWLNATSEQIKGGVKTPPASAVSLTLKAIDFAYGNDNTLLKKANLSLAAGKTTVLVGASGSGKTTVLRLLLGQLTPQGGSVVIGGTPLDELDMPAWRDCIGWMSQHPHLLADTLRANLQLALSDSSDADDEVLINALQTVELTTWFEQLPEGLDTLLGENGRQLSGGQLRRLALARVVLSNAKILLFDEPTASLDEDLEQQLLKPMRELCRDKTVLILTHRRAPLKLADKVVRIEDGQFLSDE
ncbi:MAG: thiol reductant ABC exporter subunit CydD [Gammaproteobacteria bacterium]|nr:MAG: thiol reductant ABC exporter subunit CydD [Gammaproteobacteria bacterium]